MDKHKTVRALFVHQNFPGQYKDLVRLLASDPKNKVVFITKPNQNRIAGVHQITYQPARTPSSTTHPYIVGLENGVLHGQAVARVALDLKKRGFRPDIICGHCGWGETLFLKDVYPDVPLINFFEFFYHASGSDVGFDPEYPSTFDNKVRAWMKNTINLLSLEACDRGISPTVWQHKQYPPEFQPKISVIHDGIDTDAVTPDPKAQIRLPNGRMVRHGDEVVTYVARNLEPYRGFHIFMRTVEEICHRRPRAEILIVGGDGVSYGRRPADGQTYREKLLSEVTIDPDRVHFLGRVPYSQFLALLRVSAVHVYLTYPFVLSWSMLEAMAAGCVIVGSATPPVEEVIVDGENGLLVDFFAPKEIADRVDAVLEHPDRMAKVRAGARQTIIERYDLRRICLPRHLKLMQNLMAGGTKARDPAQRSP